MPGDRFFARSYYRTKIGDLILIQMLIDSTHPFDASMQEGSAEPVANPSSRILNWLNQAVP
jgi:hypothetical protein